jgi:flagellar biosynthesis protein FlhB
MEETETIDKNFVSKKGFETFKIILMIGLIITMLVLAFVIWNYIKQMKLDPCNFCSSCKTIGKTIVLNSTQLKGGMS